MFKNFIRLYKNLDLKILSILKYGLWSCFLVSILSTILLLTYLFVFKYTYIYYIGLLLFLLSFNTAVSLIISATIINNVKNI